MRSSLRLSTALVAAAGCTLLAVAPALAEDTDTAAKTVESTGTAENEDDNNDAATEDSDNEGGTQDETDQADKDDADDADTEGTGKDDGGKDDEGKDGSGGAKGDGGSSNSPDDGNTTPWLRILDASSKSKAAPIIGVILAVVSLLLAAYNTFGSQIPALQKLIKG
ncbi:hypothetical protein NQ042_10770 [Corynebacterium phoceense]|uniref:hypothetical protein n=1 Tax=Corynebacterium phoceense TaxID=1686286 RepID=UPI00211C6760|nr:hypothetical protein [Corynebacterium phoceense]MCQ9334547.1 hypothetical protein [Corynebacterium phoceense]